MKRVLFIAGTALILASCKKEASVNPNPGPGINKENSKLYIRV